MIAANSFVEVLGTVLVIVLLIALLGAVAWVITHLIGRRGNGEIVS